MAYPIKYIENNLVFNHDGECFAYYELLPYYSWEQSAASIDNRTNALKGYLTGELQ